MANNIKQTLSLIPGVNLVPKSVDSILSVFTSTVNELKAAQAHQYAQRDTLATQAAALKAQSEAADVEAGRAANATKKIEQLLA